MQKIILFKLFLIVTFYFLGVHDKRLAIWLSSVTALVNCIVSFVSLSFIDKVRRRTLTMLSLLGVVISLVILASAFQLSAR